jgi:hypothetical protein
VRRALARARVRSVARWSANRERRKIAAAGVSFARRRRAHGVYRKCTPRAPSTTTVAAGLIEWHACAPSSDDRFSPSSDGNAILSLYVFSSRRRHRLVLLLWTEHSPASLLSPALYSLFARHPLQHKPFRRNSTHTPTTVVL